MWGGTRLDIKHMTSMSRLRRLLSAIARRRGGSFSKFEGLERLSDIWAAERTGWRCVRDLTTTASWRVAARAGCRGAKWAQEREERRSGVLVVQAALGAAEGEGG